MKLIFKRPFKITVLAISILILTTTIALAQEETQIYLEATEAQSGIVTVDIVAMNVADLYGAEVKLRYDPTDLTVQDADPDREGVQIIGGQLLSVDQGFVVANQADNEAGTVTYAITLLNPAPPIDGTGTLATVTFEKLKAGPVVIEFEKAKLVASTLQAIPSQANALELGSQNQQSSSIVAEGKEKSPVSVASNESSTNKKSLSHWLVVGGAIALAIVAIVVLFGLVSVALFGRQSKTTLQKSTKSKLAPQVWLRPVSRMRIQRPRLHPPRRGARTRSE